MIVLHELRISENPMGVAFKWLVEARFTDADSSDPLNYRYDKMFSLGGERLRHLLDITEYQITCMLSAPDPYDLEALNEYFKERE